MSRSLLPRFVAVAVAAAVAGVPLLPPQHVHRAGIEGRSQAVAHSHRLTGRDLPDAPIGSSLTVPHGSHSSAVFLTQAYEAGGTGPQTLDVALLDPAIPSIDLLVLAAPPTEAFPSAHGPPSAIWLTRGPPASF